VNEFERLETIVRGTHSTYNEYPPDQTKQLICAALGLSGEAGEATDQIKKWFEQGRVLDTNKLLMELADVAYYVTLALLAIKKTPEDMVDALQEKLSKRYPNGFSTEASQNRSE
jgi:NTP pyrophosphatase (non-canonical NTP hydrolase)